MPVDIRDHPDAPSLEALQEIVLEPVPRDEIEDRLDRGEHLNECVLNDHDGIDAYVEFQQDPMDEDATGDVGTGLYRFVQLFGTPQVPGFDAGSDLTTREDATFKYLFRARAPETDELPDEWLVTAFDWHVQLGVGVAEWGDDPAAVDPREDVALVSFALLANVATEPVECEYEDVWY